VLRIRWVVATGIVAALLAAPATAAAVAPQVRAPHRAEQAAKPYFDSRAAARRNGGTALGRTTRQRSAMRALRSRLGRQA
jgi:hypothetical protein